MGLLKRLMFGVFRATSGLKKSIVGKGHVSPAKRAIAKARLEHRHAVKSRSKTAGHSYLTKKQFWRVRRGKPRK